MDFRARSAARRSVITSYSIHYTKLYEIDCDVSGDPAELYAALSEGHPVVFRRIQQARSRRPDMKLVVIDPRRTMTAEQGS